MVTRGCSLVKVVFLALQIPMWGQSFEDEAAKLVGEIGT